MSGITTHVLDTSAGRPAAGMAVKLEVRSPERGWVTLAERVTDAGGRAGDLVADGSKLDAGTYTIEAWHEKLGTQSVRIVIGDKETKEIAFSFKAS